MSAWEKGEEEYSFLYIQLLGALKMTTEGMFALFSTLTAVLALGISLWSAINQKKQTDHTLHVTILRDFVREFFYDDHIQVLRREASQFGLERPEQSEAPGAVFDLFDFFDTFAMYYNKKAVDPEMAWCSFYYWFSHYWQAFADDISRFHKHTGLDMYRNLEQMMEIWPQLGEALERIPSPHVISQDQLRRFFEDELAACGGAESKKR